MNLNTNEELIEFCNSKYLPTDRHPDLYIPVVVNNQPLIDRGPRFYDNQYESRLKHLDVRGKRVLDIGSNTGFISNWCATEGGALHVTGIDIKEEMIHICNSTKELSNINNVEYVLSDKHDFTKNVNTPYDVALQLSNFDNKVTITELEEYGHIAKVWYIEPTNRPWGGVDKGYDREWLENWGQTELSKFGKVELLTLTDYQGRGLFKLTISETFFKPTYINTEQ